MWPLSAFSLRSASTSGSSWPGRSPFPVRYGYGGLAFAGFGAVGLLGPRLGRRAGSRRRHLDPGEREAIGQPLAPVAAQIGFSGTIPPSNEPFGGVGTVAHKQAKGQRDGPNPCPHRCGRPGG